jgi:hypothetical protein
MRHTSDRAQRIGRHRVFPIGSARLRVTRAQAAVRVPPAATSRCDSCHMLDVCADPGYRLNSIPAALYRS